MTAETPDRTWGLAPDVAWDLTPEGQAVVMALGVGWPMLLSPSGTAIWEVLVDGRTPEDDLVAGPPAAMSTTDLAAQVADAFGLEPSEVADDVAAFLRMLESHRILARHRGPGTSSAPSENLSS